MLGENTLKEINKMSYEIEQLYSLDDKFLINHWYSFPNTYMGREDIFKVTSLTKNHVIFHSIDGELEKEVQQELPNSFEKNSTIYKDAEKLSMDDTFKILMQEIKKLASK